MEELKYYTPDISELYVGYECEHTSDTLAFFCENEDDIIKDKLTPYDLQKYLRWGSEEIDGLKRHIRTPYLTKEQIEKEGWELYGKSIDLWFKKEVLTENFDWSGLCNLYGYKPYKLFLNYGMHDCKITIKCDFSGGQNFNQSDTLFEGYCPSINEYRTICKLLRIC